MTVSDERAHAQRGREREALLVRVPGLLELGKLVGANVPEQLQTPSFPPRRLVRSRQRHRLLRLLPRLAYITIANE